MEKGNFRTGQNSPNNWEIAKNQEISREQKSKIGRGVIESLRSLESARNFEKIGTAELFEIFEKDKNPENLMDFNKSPEELENWLIDGLTEIRNSKHGDITKIGIVSGSFDVPHENHTWYIRHAKLLLAEDFCRENNLPVNEEILNEVIEKGLVKLIASLDTDKHIEFRKSKPDDIRPIYPLEDRARRIAEITISGQNSRTPAVDFVIPEGEEYQGSMYQDLLQVMEKISEQNLLDARICFGEHPQDIEDTQNLGLKPLSIPFDMTYATGRDGQRISSSAIIKKIRNQDNGGQEWTQENQMA